MSRKKMAKDDIYRFQPKRPRLSHDDKEERNSPVNPVAAAISEVTTGKITTGPGSCFTSVEWKIQNFFWQRWKMNDCIDSPNFYFLDGTWFFRMYPNGETEQSWIDVYLLTRKTGCMSRAHRIRCRIGLRKKDGNEHCSQNSERDFDKCCMYTYFRKIISRAELNRRRNEFALEGAVTVFCILSVRVCETREMAAQTDSEEGVHKLIQNVKSVLQTGEESDLILIVRDRKIKCHRAVLAARCSVFADMLKREQKVVEIEDCEPNAYLEFLTYLYSGSVKDFSKENAVDLHRIADKYDSQEVKTRCIDLLTNGLSVENFCDVILSMRPSETELLKTTVSFFAKNVKKIIVTTEWQNFLKKNLAVANALYSKALDYYVIP